MANLLDTTLNADCECPEAPQATPTECPPTSEVVFQNPEIHTDECGVCVEDIVCLLYTSPSPRD